MWSRICCCKKHDGNDIVTVEDKALVNSKMKNTKVSVVSFQKNDCEVDGGKIVNISIYHYIEFTREGMKLWRYYEIGSGNFQLFNKNLSFQCGLKVVTHFTKCADNIEPTTAEAKNPDLTNNVVIANCVILFFWAAAHCSATFKTFGELESHIVKRIHSVPKAASFFDYAKKSFANRMILAARSHSFVTSSPTAPASNAFGAVIPLFLQQGWGLPIRSTFRFNAAQKAFLFKIFENVFLLRNIVPLNKSDHFFLTGVSKCDQNHWQRCRRNCQQKVTYLLRNDLRTKITKVCNDNQV